MCNLDIVLVDNETKCKNDPYFKTYLLVIQDVTKPFITISGE
jgi:hypothetical protein